MLSPASRTSRRSGRVAGTWRRVAEPPILTRRALLALTGIGTAGLWLTACQGSSPASPGPTGPAVAATPGSGSTGSGTGTGAVATSGATAVAPAGSQSAGATVSGVRLPSFFPMQGPAPELAGDS